MKPKISLLLCLFTVTLLVAVNVFASRSDKMADTLMQQTPVGSQEEAARQGRSPVEQKPPQIKWNMPPRQISQEVDKMIAAVNKSNPIARDKQMAFTRALSNVRDAVVKNDMAAYQKAVTVLAGVSSNLNNEERRQLNQSLPAAPPSSSCSISCLFGTCTATCSAGAGSGAACLCIYGFPQCGCGGGGSYI